MSALTYRKTYTLPEFKAATGSKVINFHQVPESGKLYFTTDTIVDDCKVSNKLSIIDIQSEPEKLRVSDVIDTDTNKEFFLIHFPKSDNAQPVAFSL